MCFKSIFFDIVNKELPATPSYKSSVVGVKLQYGLDIVFLISLIHKCQIFGDRLGFIFLISLSNCF
jgi:hypothetical protein